MRRSILCFVAALAAVASLLASVSPTSAAAPEAPDLEEATYIVVLEGSLADGVPTIASGLARQHDGQVERVYQHALQGFSVKLSAAAARTMAADPLVAYVERDREISLAAQEVPTGIDRSFASANPEIGIDGSDDLRVDVDVAVIDTGVDLEHPDLDVVDGVTCINGNCRSGGDDDHYHGTHVAGSIAAIDNDLGVVGVAPGARIHAVKVLDSQGSGFTSWIVAGIDWVAGQGDIEVANMSLGGFGYSQAQYDAIQGAVDAGVAFAVAAGNSDDFASRYSPAAFDNVLTVSALADFNGSPGGGAAPTCRSDIDDTLADFSNYGNAVDLAGPGVCIASTFPVEQGGYGTISGTSMASPHAAGALALLASTNPPTNAAQVASLYAQVIGAGNTNWTDDSGDGTTEPLLDVSDSSLFDPTMVDIGGPGNTAPTVSITSPADGDSFASGATVNLSADTFDADGDPVTVSWTANGASVPASGWTPADGSYNMVATADDGQGGTAADSVSITVVGEDPPVTLAGTAFWQGRRWVAVVTASAPEGTTVSGQWRYGRKVRNRSCTVAAGDTSCDLVLPNISRRIRFATFTTTDGDSIRIDRP